MRILFIILIAGIFLIGLLQSCKHEIELIPQETTSNSCDKDTVYFENDVLPLIISSCAKSGCHDKASHKDDIILDSYENIMDHGEIKPGKPNSSELIEVMLESDPSDVMPPPPLSPLSSEEIGMISKWISQGANNNSCNDCDTSNVSYSQTISKIISTNCSACHNANNATGGVILDSYSEIKKEVDSKRLKKTINHLPGFKVMPPGYKLSDCNIKSIEIWIQNGAPNN